ncbi:MAG: zinc ribbon domain-containing protein [Terriglobia bacterium]
MKTLIELQELDSSVSALSSRIDSTPQQVQALKAQLSDFIRIYEERKARLSANQKERRDLDGDVQTIRAKIARHKDQLYQVKTNEQYRAMLKEVEGEEANLGKAEDRILEKMVEAEQIEKQIREASSILDAETARIEREIRDLEAARKEAEQHKAALFGRRAPLVAALPEHILNHYERLRRGRNGIALAEVRDGLCTGCHVRLRPQAYNEIRTGEVFMTCEACARILFYSATPPPDTAAGPGSGAAEG